MDIARQFDEYCYALESTKITARRQACSDIIELLHRKNTIKYLNTGGNEVWQKVLTSIQSCMMKEVGGKKIEDGKKRVPIVSIDAYVTFLRIAANENAPLNFRRLFIFITESLNDKTKIYYHDPFLNVLSQSFLTNATIRSSLQSRDWETLFFILKRMCEKKSADAEQFKCLLLVVKWGPLYNFPMNVFREEFPFMTKLCQNVEASSLKFMQEFVLEIVFEFSKHAASDNRMACCKLGEEVYIKLLDLYQDNGNDDKMRVNLVEFFLFQVAIHHPNGVKKDHPAAYAVSWNTWQNCLLGIYNALNNEIEVALKYPIRSKAFFVRKDNAKHLLNSFVSLFVEVCNQIFSSNVSTSNDILDPEERPFKRARLEISMKNLIDNIKNSKSWTWINITYKIIKKYPTLIESENYMDFFRLLSTFQSESKDADVTYHTYKALVILEQIENVVNLDSYKTEIDQLWKNIVDCAIRSMGVSQYDKQVQKLLQSLIMKKVVNSHENIFQSYRSGGTFSLTKENLKTLDIVFTHFNYLQFDTSLKIEIMQWILNGTPKLLCYSFVAETLIKLTLKQWPNSTKEPIAEVKSPFKDIEETYLYISYENLVTSPEKPIEETTNNVFCSDPNLLNTLVTLFHDLIKKLDINENIEAFFNITLLIFNVISFLIKYELIETSAINNLSLLEQLEICSRTVFANLNLSVDVEGRNLKEVTENVQTLKLLFSTNISPFTSKKLRELIPTEFIRAMFNILKVELKDPREDVLLELQKTTMEALTAFSCFPDARSLLTIQQKALECLLDTEYDFRDDKEYELVLTFLQSLKDCKPKLLSEDICISIFNLFQRICEARYRHYSSAVKILELFYDIYPFVVHLEICRSQFVQILYPFYEKRSNYGPRISVLLLNCMGLLFELAPSCEYSKWKNEEIVLKIPEFLSTEFQAIRFAAIKNLANFFKISSKTRLLEQFHKQEIMFMKIIQMNSEVLQIEGNLSQERVIDETVTRTATIFHTCTSVMSVSYLWIDEALFALLKLVCDKNINLIQVKKVIEVVAKNLCFEGGLSFLERYVVSLFNRWKSNDIQNFPFKLYNCENKIEFYAKYWNSIAPIIIEIDSEKVQDVASALGKTVEEVLENVCPKLLSTCIAENVADLTLLTTSKIYQLLSKVLGVKKLTDMFQSKIEEILLNLFDFVYDENNFKKNFGENIIHCKFNGVRLTIEEFQDCIQFIENTVYQDTSLILHLSKNSPEKIHLLLLNLNLKINSTQALEEKLRYFYLYAITATMCLEGAIDEASLRTYLIRNTSYNILHFIKSHKDQPELSKISCKFFQMFLKKVVPHLVDTLKQFFLIIVSRLKNLALENCEVSDMCVEILHFLIIDNEKYFTKELKKLDSIPKTSKFEKIYSIHFKLKYDNRNVTLEDEIRQFLDFSKNIESFDECEHSLKHLKELFSTKKDELRRLYEDIRKTRGFSEDCEKSCLHQLICMLITLCSSSNSKISREAARCLGEIGPADLATLILQPEKPIFRGKTPWELVLGYSLSLLSKYLVDHDVNVINVASTALFRILSTKEGRKIAESGTDFGFGVINYDYLTPFFSTPVRKNNFNININGEDFVATVADDNLWTPENLSHKTWVTELVCTLLESFQENEFFSCFINVCKLKIEFCEQILPLIVYTILHLKINVVSNLISTKIESFFSKHWEITVINKNTQSNSITVNKSSVQCMLNVIHFIRLQKNDKSKRPLKDLNFDYLKAAKAAHYCTAHFTALLYADLWCQEQINRCPDDYSASTCNSTKLDLIYEKVDEITGNALHNIFRKAYKAVGEVDALLGCGTSYLLNDQSRNEHYKELGKWQQVIHHYEINVSHGQHSSLQPLVESLNNSNLYQLSLFCSNSLKEPSYESLWRLSQWNYNKPAKNNDLTYENYDKFKFYALKALHDDDEFNFKNSLDNVKSCIVHNLLSVNLESSKNLYNNLTELQSLKELEDFFQAVSDNKLQELINKWKIQDAITENDYHYIEPIKTQRIVLLTQLLKKGVQSRTLNDGLVDMILDFSQYSRVENNPYTASRALQNLRLLPSLSNDIIARIQLEEAQICWSLQDITSAKCMLRQLCTNENVNTRLKSMALKLTGKLMVENSSESRQTIIEDYFQKSLTLLKKSAQKTESVEDQKSVLDTYDQLAKFADNEYQQVMSHIKSDIFQKKKENMMKAKQAVSKFKSSVVLKKVTKDLQKAVAIKEKQSSIDQIEIQNIETEKNNLLKFALKYYLFNLIHSDNHNITIFRLISLLLENRNNDVIKSILETELIKIPTYKFINILPQIIPHISSATNDLFCETVNAVIEKCAKEHPYHTLPLILALALSNRDRSYAESKAMVNEVRMQSAKNLLKKLRRDSALASLIDKMENLSEALIELAYHKGSDIEDGHFRLPKKSKIRQIQGYDDVLLPTYSLPVDKTCNYNRIIGISTFGDYYDNVGGLNAPKRITCKGTDGITRTQLVKGQDDLRQDAVMQQVFTIMNSLLAVNKPTKNLLIRTYKIVPLSMRSGVLEWVENTIPIGEYLTGGDEEGAHVKYRPNDRTPQRCRNDFKNAGQTLEAKLRVFNNICKNIKPVFHKFFETSFPQPTVWYERRRAYTHSVATSSMCGYILGIGDRHVNNILIDKNTAEVVHIDFGIAFEQGGVLPTPETVPFRLTRDVVDGMGVSGVEGVFRRSCEKTLEVLRLHYQTIITILEVLLYDPLYDWTVSTAEANKRQKDEQDSEIHNLSAYGSEDDSSRDVNITAERALLRLRAKLQGTEHGKLTTVEHQVASLIQQAVDPSNLCRLFHGWQPYL